jgi:hypothetical protein
MAILVHAMLTCLFLLANAADKEDLSLLQTHAKAVKTDECVSSIVSYTMAPGAPCPGWPVICTNLNEGQPGVIGAVYLKPVMSPCGPDSLASVSVRTGGSSAWPLGGPDITQYINADANQYKLPPTFIDWEKTGTEPNRLMATVLQVSNDNCGGINTGNINTGVRSIAGKKLYVCISHYVFPTPSPTPGPKPALFWAEESANMICTQYEDVADNVFPGNRDQVNQVDCQNKCGSSCIGITYSNDMSYTTKRCYLCENDQLSSSWSGYGFFRKPESTPTTTTTMTTTTTTTTTTISLQELDDDEVQTEIADEHTGRVECQKWCHSKKHRNKPWQGKKCTWSACKACSQCA